MLRDINKPTLFLFTDASADPKTKIGYGAYLLLDKSNLESPLSKLKVNIKRFEDTSSSKLELETLLWALQGIPIKDSKIVIYTDCQNIISLKQREDGLKKSNFMTKKGTLLKNHELYKEFYKFTNLYECNFIKVKGHKRGEEKNRIDNYFTLVDKESREALRKNMKATASC